MINHNGKLVGSQEFVIGNDNRAFNYGDGLFETMKVVSGTILFFEDHYFRLMASMRILRMEIPMNFTMEFLASEIQKLLAANQLEESVARIKLFVNRKAGGLYTPNTNDIDYLISTDSLANAIYTNSESHYEIDLFKDYYVAPVLLSTIKSNNKIINVLAGIYSEENNYQNAIILNTNKMVVEMLNANIFIVKDNFIITPPLSDGCLKGIMRKQIMELVNQTEEYEMMEASISPFELIKANEIFITNVISGIQSVSKYRKKEFTNSVAMQLVQKLNNRIKLLS